MKKMSFFVLVLAMGIILVCGCSFSSSLSSMDEDFSEPEVVSPSSSLSADSLDESESTEGVSSLSSNNFSQPPYPIALPEGEPLYTTEDGNVWLVNVGYRNPEGEDKKIAICVTLPEEYYVVNTIIYSPDRDTKVAELYSLHVPDGKTLAGMFEEENETNEFLVGIMDNGGYTQSDGREVSFQIIENSFEWHEYIYEYYMKITDGVVVGLTYRADAYNSEEVKPLIEPIFASIQLYEA